MSARRFCATKFLKSFVRDLTEVSRFILRYMWEEHLGTQADFHFIEGVRLIGGPHKKLFLLNLDLNSVISSEC